MSSEGLFTRYPINRLLTGEEIRNRLSQKEPSRSPPHDRLSVIKMNSTFLECCDIYFGKRGKKTAAFLGILIIGLYIFQDLILSFLFQHPDIDNDTRPAALLIIFFLVLVFGFILLRHELFKWTHYPIRFNRKTRMVYVFGQDGTVLCESWDKLCFVLSKCRNGKYEIRAHCLAEDDDTVLETFSLPYESTYSIREKVPDIFSQWEFVRRYMEDGPEKLVRVLKFTMNVAEKRETYYDGYQRLGAGLPPVLFVLFSPLTFFYAIGRWLSMQSSEIPVWPAEIEAECAIAPDDPYQVDEQHPPEGVEP